MHNFDIYYLGLKGSHTQANSHLEVSGFAFPEFVYSLQNDLSTQFDCSSPNILTFKGLFGVDGECRLTRIEGADPVTRPVSSRSSSKMKAAV